MIYLVKHRILLSICLLLATHFAIAQNNGLVRYDAINGTTDYIKDVQVDTSKLSNSTIFNTGELSNVADLNTRKSLSHMPGSGFTDVYSASSWFNTSTYPARTAVKLFYYRNGSLHELCSGTLISDNMVVTSAHCIYYYFDETDLERNWLDSILVIPSYDNSTIKPEIGRTISTKFYVFENWYDEIDLNYDMAFLELQKPIGNKTGWVGIGYTEQSDFYTNSIFHNFSYPSAVHPFDSTRIYDGNMLFYSYGALDTVAKYEIGHKVNAIPGQSGSSVIHSDNSVYHVYGVLSNHLYGYGTLFNRITPNKFYAIKNLLENETAIIDGSNIESIKNTAATNKTSINENYNLTSPKSNAEIAKDFLNKPTKKSNKKRLGLKGKSKKKLTE
ncbi:MAG: trypsin-like serine protease [Bacteroidia bacterium]|nr:trypsin-like serine protease [Bacteroidia bacterium]NNC85150.1 trypsin-like serine protease [Bacteroidia bacterium]NNM15457.1 trypsin-like serine protease [Bacteroidia bacterium]